MNGNIDNELDQFGFRLKALSIDYFHLSYAKDIEKVHNVKLIGAELQINIETKLVSGFSIKNSICQYQINVVYATKVDEVLITLAEIKTTFDFFIKNIEQYIDKSSEKEAIILSTAIGTSMIGVAASTTRGILHGKLSGTYLGNIYMPLVDPSLFMAKHPLKATSTSPVSKKHKK